MVQMPFQLNAFLPFCSAMMSASWAILAGEWPFFTRSVNQVIALTPGSSAQVTLLASGEKSSPPYCHSSDWTVIEPVNGNGVAQSPWIPLLFMVSSAWPYSSALVGGFSGSRPAFSITVLL